MTKKNKQTELEKVEKKLKDLQKKRRELQKREKMKEFESYSKVIKDKGIGSPKELEDALVFSKSVQGLGLTLNQAYSLLTNYVRQKVKK